MEVNCLTLKDLINPRQSRLDFAIEDGENAQKVSALKYLKALTYLGWWCLIQ